MVAPAALASRLLAAALCVAAAGMTAFAASEPDSGGSSPHRVITLSPHATEIIHAAGAGHTLVGTVSSSDFPDSARALPRVGDGILLNQERILTLRPTLVVGWLRSAAARQVETLAARLGAEVMYSRPLRLLDIPEEVRRLGQRLGTRTEAERAAGQLEARIRALETRHAGQPRVKVFIELGDRPLYTIGADPLINDVLRTCGAVNVYADTGMPAPRVPVESVLVQRPELLVATEQPHSGAAEVRKRWAERGLEAAQKGHLHLADPDALYRPGPRLVDAAEALCAAVDAARSGFKTAEGASLK